MSERAGPDSKSLAPCSGNLNPSIMGSKVGESSEDFQEQ